MMSKSANVQDARNCFEIQQGRGALKLSESLPQHINREAKAFDKDQGNVDRFLGESFTDQPWHNLAFSGRDGHSDAVKGKKS